MDIIKTKRFTLRPYRLADAEDIFRHINDRAIGRNMGSIPHPYPLVAVKKWLRKTVAHNKRDPKQVNWAIVIDGEVVGSIGGHIHRNGHKMSLGYWLGRKHRGKGIVTEVIRVFTEHFFRTRKLRRIEAETFLFNPASARVLEKNKFQKEGLLRKNYKKGTKILDTYIFAKVK